MTTSSRPAVLPCSLLCSLLYCLPAGLTHAADTDTDPGTDTGTDPSLVIDKYIQHFKVEPDGSFVLTVDNVKTIAQQRAVQGHSQYYISYNKTLDDVIAVEGYTEKPDGRRVAVQLEHIKDQQEAVSSDAPMFQDTRVKIVVFPEVAVGDKLAVHYVIKRSTPLFPGHFEDLSSSQFYVNRQFLLIYDMPASMPLYADAAGFVAVAAEAAPGRKLYQWRYEGGDNARIEADSVSYLDYGKRLAVSTFADYAAFARAYHARARDKSEVTAAIAALARKLTRDLDGPRATALALADWVRNNIRYVGVWIGAGGVVPHPAATVLENRYGDCKDHASLLEALLAAVGIDSTGALINSGNAYQLPSTPTLGVFNHVITYVPSLDLYLDSTAESIAAGYLPSSGLGKPVLLTSSGQMALTPSVQVDQSRTVTWFDVSKNGHGSFMVVKLSAGALAEPYRKAVRDTRPAERAQFVQRMLQDMGQKGRGVFDAGKLDGGADEYSMQFSGTSENFIDLPGPVAVATSYSFWGGMKASVATFAREAARSQDFVCPAIDAEDVTGLHFPAGVRIVARPKPLTLHDANFSYAASYATTYTRKGSTVLVKRALRFRHHKPVCTPAEYRRMQPLLERIVRDLKSQLIVASN